MIRNLTNCNRAIEDRLSFFSNYYINLFNVLLLIDCKNKEKDKSLLYNGIDVYYDDEDNNDITNYKEVLEETYNSRGHYIETPFLLNRIKYFNPLVSYIKISKSTFDLLMDSKVLSIDVDNNYDILIKKINDLILLAQDRLEEYLKDSIDEEYSIYDLYKEYILSYYLKESNGVMDRLYGEVDSKIYCKYNEVFKIYLDTLKLITIYSKYITEFQVSINSNPTINDKIKEVINSLGMFNISFNSLINTIDSISYNDSIIQNKFIKNGSSYMNALKSIGYDMNRLKHDSYYLNTMYSIPNSIFNLFSELNSINNLIKKSSSNMEELVLYRPKFNNLKKIKERDKLSIISNIISSSNLVSKKVDEFTYISQTSNSFTYSSVKSINRSYGSLLKYACGDNSEGIITASYSKRPIYRYSLLYSINSIFDGSIQNDKMYDVFRDNNIKYTSSVWLKPLYKDELLVSKTIDQTHLNVRIAPKSYKVHRRDNVALTSSMIHYLKMGSLNAFDNFCTFDYFSDNNLMNNGIPYLESIEEYNDSRVLASNEYKRKDSKGINNSTFYTIQLGNVFMIRSYIISILEMISRMIKNSNLKELSIDELKEFKKAYRSSFTYNISSMVSDFNNGNNEMRYSKKMHTSHYVFPESSMAVQTSRYTRTFYLYFMDSLHLNTLMLDKINTIAKEDYLTCPMM